MADPAIRMVWAVSETTDDGLVHVYPLAAGPAHELRDGHECWCHAERDDECPTVVMHNLPQ
jgi:hypothetical protein